MQIEAGRLYRGADGSGLLVQEVAGDVAHVLPAMSDDGYAMPLADLEAWATGLYQRPGPDEEAGG